MHVSIWLFLLVFWGLVILETLLAMLCYKWFSSGNKED